LTFHPDRDDAYKWMGFEAREAILDTLDAAIADGANVFVVATTSTCPTLSTASSRSQQAEDHH